MTIALPKGFRFAGVHCGIKQAAGVKDMSLIVSDQPATAAGVYTQNLVFAAPVQIDRSRTPMADARFVVVNSGNANACTGPRGLADAQTMLSVAADACGCSPSQGLVMSTGVIGVFLPMEKIAAGTTAAAQSLGDDEAAFLAASDGVLTTDSSRKIAARSLAVQDSEIRLVGMAKGAGMIGPHMATMLCVIATDAALEPADAQAMLRSAVEVSFNCISVEGHTSTNDTVLLLANGAATGKPLTGSDREAFQAALVETCTEMARMIPSDGEGATHLITIDVCGAASTSDARRIAKAIAESALVKTAVAGADPNWGRIVSAAGYAGAKFDPARVDLHINDHLIYQQGSPAEFEAKVVSRSIRGQHETFLRLDLNAGDANLRFWTSDLTVDYIKFNSEYTT
ncbi:bifunctional glutamate N-acetyltransferase/amino-acid acetyltransferase ArgJ [Lignipirellula cremea]|uniref:Arginine biosynthesis bifunctional protein ArgJ n=1 Tax=Lignipirellula cremea TaxID=2528010 RepID=A0A518DWV7_9BACT|nr:bifunctional glutamate N-acetyltransferase/amino-acid acetyltransferase ArgJ [Lignipirellula cremea]QDU96304.1 Arginine biosynthesis bifunctional protein ArgJ [Lignipirellula cremea]